MKYMVSFSSYVMLIGDIWASLLSGNQCGTEAEVKQFIEQNKQNWVSYSCFIVQPSNNFIHDLKPIDKLG